MKIAIIADSHDRLKNLQKIINYLNNQKIKLIIHCGDICSKKTLSYLKNNFLGQIYFIAGNAETYRMSKFKYQMSNFFRDIGEIKIGNRKILFTHKLENISNLLTKNPDIIFYGHTHKPWINTKTINNKKIIIANPGNTMGEPYQATFAIYNTINNQIELKILNLLNKERNV